ncbi:MAG: hypothetical protein LBL33_03665 [Tannerella sp.]|nr:hypothetical protein [Tannerella sp.]
MFKEITTYKVDKEMEKMESLIVKSNKTSVTNQITIPIDAKEMLTTEEYIQKAVNEAVLPATRHALSQFDTDGTLIQVSQKKHTGKGQISKTYQCPFGEFELCRHVYQRTEGGKTHCPLDKDACVIIFSTPKFAKMASSRYTCGSSRQVQRDLKANHSRIISGNYIRDISQSAGKLSETVTRDYCPEAEMEEVSSTGISLDSTCMFMRQDGWRQAVAGSMNYYDESGERLYTVYVANSPEYGKETFYKSFQKEIEEVRKRFRGKRLVGVADGATDNRKFLEATVGIQVLDFFMPANIFPKHPGQHLNVDRIEMNGLLRHVTD